MAIKKIRIVNNSDNPIPQYETSGSVGLDMRAHLKEPIMLKPLQRALIPTGIYIELPDGYEAQIRPRSGLALKKGLSVLNAPGTIDSDYRGEIKILMINLSNESTVINTGERIAQMIINKIEKVELLEVDELTETERGEGGFGHTGIK
jgi:dUTP pyrophosphatase